MLWMLFACAPEIEPVAAVESVEAAEVAGEDVGARVFQERCATCHGAAGKGDGPAAAGLATRPADLSAPRSFEQRGPPSRAEIVRHGKAGTPMPAFEGVIPAEELAAVESYIHVLAHGAGGGDCGGAMSGDCADCAGPGGGPGSGQGRGQGRGPG